MTMKRRGLGRGLDALLSAEPAAPEPGEAAAAGPSGAVLTLAVTALQPNRYQPRTDFDEQGLEELAESIRTQGVVQPIVVTPLGDGRYAIVAGERRWRASQRAGLEQVPVVVRDVSGDRELLELALVENLQRSDLNPIEEAEAYRTLQESFGLSQDEVAHRVGKARTTVTNALRLLRLNRDVLDLLRGGRLTAGQARPLLALAEDQQVALAHQAVEQGLSARDLERLAAAPKAAKKAKVAPPVEIHTAVAAEKLTRRLRTRVEIRRRGTGGAVQIHFHSEDELMRLYDLLMDKGKEA